MKRRNECGADADRLLGVRRKFFLCNFTTFRQGRYRVSCAVLLENGVWALEFLKFYGAAFGGSMFRKTARRAAIRLLDTRFGDAARRFEKLIGCGLGSVLNFIAQIELKFAVKVGWL